METSRPSNSSENTSPAHLFALLEVLHARVTKLRDKFDTSQIHVTKEKITEFQTLAKKITQAAAELSKSVHTSIELGGKGPTENDVKLLTQALQCDPDKSRPSRNFKCSIIRIFEGPKDSTHDSTQTKARKKALRARCSTIRNLRPAVIVRWALSFGLAVWAAGIMSQDTFDYLVEQLESEVDDAIPSHICAVLHTLKTEEPLNQSHEYSYFVAALDEVAASPSSTGNPKKRKRVEAEPKDTKESLTVRIKETECGK